MIQTAKLDLFARIPVAHYTAALKWYERLPGSVPAFFPNDTEAVWELGEHRYVYVVRQPEHAGHAKHLLFVGELMRSSRRSPLGDLAPRSGIPIRTAFAHMP